MFEVDFGGAKESRLVLFEVHLLGAADEPRIVQRAGVTEVQTPLLL